MPARQQAIISANDGKVYWRIYVSLGLNELNAYSDYFHAQYYCLRWMTEDPTDDKSTLVQVMAYCHQASLRHSELSCNTCICSRESMVCQLSITMVTSQSCLLVIVLPWRNSRESCATLKWTMLSLWNRWVLLVPGNITICPRHIDGFVPERCNSSAFATELHFSCTIPSICVCFCRS